MVLMTGWEIPADDPRKKPFDFFLQKPFSDIDAIEDVMEQEIALHDERGENAGDFFYAHLLTFPVYQFAERPGVGAFVTHTTISTYVGSTRKTRFKNKETRFLLKPRFQSHIL